TALDDFTITGYYNARSDGYYDDVSIRKYTYPEPNANVGEETTQTAIDDLMPDADILTVRLNQNFPNPFNPQTTISYSLKNSSDVSLSIYNIKGELVETLVNEEQQAGDHSIVWDAEDVSSGIYLYQIKTEGSIETKKCVIMK
ncbi:MAG: T9SS type A sorting domain-containing protein, partial [Bacteroidota bacterium]|nr:T9SS type A sorting domain-containing protein [Bacteroidota bacterium]